MRSTQREKQMLSSTEKVGRSMNEDLAGPHATPSLQRERRLATLVRSVLQENHLLITNNDLLRQQRDRALQRALQLATQVQQLLPPDLGKQQLPATKPHSKGRRPRP
jgi:hypothetical protein